MFIFAAILFSITFGIALFSKKGRAGSDGEIVQKQSRPILFSAVFIIAQILIGYAFYLSNTKMNQDYNTIMRIKQNGQRAEAVVDRIFNVNCGKHRCVDADYRYDTLPDANGRNVTLLGEARLWTNIEDDPHLIYVKNTNHMPIAYDRSDPRISQPNFNDDVFTGASGQRIRENRSIIAFIFLCLFGFIIWIFAFGWIQKWRKKKATFGISPN